MPVDTTDITKTLEFYRSGGAPQVGGLSAEIQKDLQIASGATGTPGGTGLQAYNLLPSALTLYPVLTPVRNMTPRLQGRGKQSEFKAILGMSKAGGGSLNLGNIFGQEGNSGQKVDLVIEDIVALYRSIKLATAVSFEQQWAGQGFIDSKATAVVNLLRQFMIQEELALLFGQNSTAAANQFAGGAVGTPATLVASTPVTSTTPLNGQVGQPTTGGSLQAGTWTVQISGVTGQGESIASAVFTLPALVGTTNQIVVNPNLRVAFPVISWNIYLVATGTTSQNGTYVVRTTGGTIAIQNVGAGGAVYFSNGTAIAGAASVAVTSGATVPVADNSASALAYNGLFTQIYGSGQALAGGAQGSTGGVGKDPSFGFYKPGSTVVSANNVLTMVGSTSNTLENFLATLWQNAFADPAWLLMYQQEARLITKSTLGAGAPFFVIVPQGEQNDATANFRVSRFTNPISGSEIEVKVHPYFQQGTILAGSDKLPDWYVPSDIPAPWALDCLQDYLEVDYPPVYNTTGTGDNWTIQIMNMCTFKLFIPALFGALDSIVAS